MTSSSDMLAVSLDCGTPHIALLPSAGMGHLTPFLRLAAALSDRSCDVSLITTHPTVSATESRHVDDFIAAFPRIRQLELHLPMLDPSGFTNTDPFLLRFEAIRQSPQLLISLLNYRKPTAVSVLIVDITVASTFVPTAATIGLPCYVLFTSSAAMLSLCAYFPTYISMKGTACVGDVDIPGVETLPKSSVPFALRDSNNLFTIQFVESGQALCRADGILINTLEALEPKALAALNDGKVVPGLPPVFAIGPLQPLPRLGGTPSPMIPSWLDEQPDRSVVYVSFGSRMAMSMDQIKEMGIGLERSGCRFLWVVKTRMVDKDEEVALEELLGEGYLERVKGKGMVMKGWVEQEEILKHRAVGSFLSHCGWNSVTEAVMNGVRVLAWPLMGDQRVNAEIVARSGLGLWVEEWSSWEGTQTPEVAVVKGEEIGERVRELMGNEGLRASATKLAEEATKAVGLGGRSHESFTEFIGMLKA